MKSRLVVLLGPVASGKSTQSKLLAEYLRRRGYKVKRTYLKTVFIFTRLISKLPLLFGENMHRALVKVDLLFNILVLTLLHIFKVAIPYKLGYVVVVEEHLYGSIVDYIHAHMVLNIERGYVFRLVKLLARALDKPEPMIVVLIADLNTLKKRQIVRDNRQEFSTYLYVQYKIFDSLSKYADALVFTDRKSVAQTFREILERVVP